MRLEPRISVFGAIDEARRSTQFAKLVRNPAGPDRLNMIGKRRIHTVKQPTAFGCRMYANPLNIPMILQYRRCVEHSNETTVQ
jgi:hypothetical protein